MTPFAFLLWLVGIIICILVLCLCIDTALRQLLLAWRHITKPAPPVQQPSWRTFKEPSTGATMRRGHWYVIGDSGHLYTPTHFPTAKSAIEWALKKVTAEYDVPTNFICCPVYSYATHGWDTMEGCNIVFADHLRDFWLESEPELVTSHG